jgi:hypothetical protein
MQPSKHPQHHHVFVVCSCFAGDGVTEADGGQVQCMHTPLLFSLAAVVHIEHPATTKRLVDLNPFLFSCR